VPPNPPGSSPRLDPIARPAAMRSAPDQDTRDRGLLLEEYEPSRMLSVPQTRVPTPRHPVIDFHTHLTWSLGLEEGDEVAVIAEASDLLPVMDAKNVRAMVNLTGGYGDGLHEALRAHRAEHPDRFVVFTWPCWNRIAEPDYPSFQADQIERAHRAGARGPQVLKVLGLYARGRQDGAADQGGRSPLQHAWTSTRTCTSASPRGSASSAASPGRRGGSSTRIKTGSCSGPMPCRGVPNSRSKSSPRSCTRSTIASWRPRTSISATPRREAPAGTVAGLWPRTP
jgi:hypothetical protein